MYTGIDERTLNKQTSEQSHKAASSSAMSSARSRSLRTSSSMGRADSSAASNDGCALFQLPISLQLMLQRPLGHQEPLDIEKGWWAF
jgi:hypothetical protein